MPRAKRAERGASRDPSELLEISDGSEGAPRARPFWSGTISFGLVTIPVDLYAATRSVRSSLRMLAPSGTPVARRYFDESGKELESAALERGYELEDGKFVPVTDEELDALAPEQSRDIDLTRFVERDSIPPLFFERAYILAPSGNSNIAYRLLASTLERTKRAGMASFVMRGKQYVVAIVAEQGLLRAETLRFAEELRTPTSIGLPEPSEPSAQKVKTMRAAIHKEHGGSPTSAELADVYWQRLEKLVEKKRKSGEDVVNPEPVEAEGEDLAEVIDLVAVLRQSLGQTESANDQGPAASVTRTRQPAARRAAAKRPANKRAAATRSSGAKAAKKAPAKRSSAGSSAAAKRAGSQASRAKPAARKAAKGAPSTRKPSKRRAR